MPLPKSKPNLGSQKLRAWLIANQMTVGKLSRVLMTTYQTVLHWCRGENMPSIRLGVEIRRVTGIPLEDWLQPEVQDDI